MEGQELGRLFSHPRDFTPVRRTELGAVAALRSEFEKRNTKVIGLSVDPMDSHDRWQKDIRDVTGHSLNFPLIADPERKAGTIHIHCREPQGSLKSRRATGLLPHPNGDRH